MAKTAENIASVVGWETVSELAAKLLELARNTYDLISAGDATRTAEGPGSDVGGRREYALVLMAAGSLAEPGRLVLRRLADQEPDPAWRADLQAVAEWSEFVRVRGQLWLREVPCLRFPPTQSLPGTPSEAEAAARAAIGRGDFAAAVPHLKRLVAQDPHEPGYRWHLGYALHRTGRSKDVIGQFRAAVRLRPGWELPYAHIGEVLLDRGQAALAVRHLTDGRPPEVRGESPYYLYVLGKAWMDCRRWGRALAAVSRCVRQPGYPRDALRCGVISAYQVSRRPKAKLSNETRSQVRRWMKRCWRQAVLRGLWARFVRRE